VKRCGGGFEANTQLVGGMFGDVFGFASSWGLIEKEGRGGGRLSSGSGRLTKQILLLFVGLCCRALLTQFRSVGLLPNVLGILIPCRSPWTV